MLKIKGDEEIIDKLYHYLRKTFNPKLRFEIKKPLRELFPKPENKWLLSIWNYGHADISVFRHGGLVTIIEPGGWYHAKDKKQRINDLKKDTLCKINKVNCLRIFNNVVENDLGNPKFKKLLKKYFYETG
jgi:hypothetical protein